MIELRIVLSFNSTMLLHFYDASDTSIYLLVKAQNESAMVLCQGESILRVSITSEAAQNDCVGFEEDSTGPVSPWKV